jgi:hypothetical protein
VVILSESVKASVDTECGRRDGGIRALPYTHS